MRRIIFILFVAGIGLIAIDRGLADRFGPGAVARVVRGFTAGSAATSSTQTSTQTSAATTQSHDPASRGFASTTTGPIQYQHIVQQNPSVHVHLITVDLTDPRVRLRACAAGKDPDGNGPWQTTILPVREIAEQNNLVAAVNANFFTCKDVHTFAGMKIPYYPGNWAVAQGWLFADGHVVSDINFAGYTLVVTRAGRVRIDYMRKLPSDAWQAVAGSEMVVKNGKIIATAKDVAPRTVVGVNKAGTQLVMMVIDGRRDDYSKGLTSADAARIMIDHGCESAINLDGGGSSTMVMRDPIDDVVRVINRPSDGHDLPLSLSLERPVAAAFGVQIVDLQKSPEK